MPSVSAVPELSPADSAWVKALSKRVFGFPGAKRMESDDWKRLQELLRTHKLVCGMESERDELCLLIYAHPEILGSEPELLANIWAGSVTEWPNKKGGLSGWDEFSPFTHSPENIARRELYAMEPLKRSYGY